MLFSKICFCVIALATLVPLAPTESLPCKIPVFRYALEHWIPDPYEVVILHRGALPKDLEELVAKMEAKATDPNGVVNLKVVRVNVENGAESELLAEVLGPAFEDKTKTPEIVLLYPAESQSGPLAWRGPLTAENVDALLNSPARNQITDWILDGESVVWVLVGVGDTTKDQAAEQLFRSEIGRLEKEIKMRDVEVIKSEKQFGANTKVELRLGIKLLVLDRNDAEEKIFAATLIRSEKDLEELDEPFAIPVFGRGRAYLSIAGKGINPRMIEKTCRFLIADCSCEIKRLNPGVDLLFAVNWDDSIVGTATIDKPLPGLAGVGVYTDADSSTAVSDQKPSAGGALEANDGVMEKTKLFGQTRLVWIIGLIFLGVLVMGISSHLRTQARPR